MYPREELELLERRKTILRTRIHIQRIDTTAHMRDVFRPVAWLSGLQAKWKGLPISLRMIMAPLSFILQRALIKRLPVRGKLLLWIPVVWKIAKWVIPLVKHSSFAARRTPPREVVKTVVKARRRESGEMRRAE